MRWQFKCALDSAKGLLPYQDQLRALKRRIFVYQPDFKHSPGALADGLTQVEWLREQLGTLTNCTVLEIGTGWEPIIPLVYRLAGAKTVYLTDSMQLICRHSVDATLRFIVESKTQICDQLHILPVDFDSLLAPVFSGQDTRARLNALNLVYMAPADCRSLPLESGSFDAIVSRAVLEHIPKDVIVQIFRESRRLLKPGGLMCHFVDNSDHWEHRDKSISRIHFLQHDEWLWRLTCLNDLNYQNRLRHEDYLDIMRREGFRVVRAEREIDRTALALLPHLKLPAPFKGRVHEDLATISSFLLASTP